MNLEKTSNQRSCCLNTSCENCEQQGCPYPKCQHVDCNACNAREICPMCMADCSKCEFWFTGCVIYSR